MKKLLAFLLAMSMMVSLVACGGSEESSEAESSTTEVQEEGQEEAKDYSAYPIRIYSNCNASADIEWLKAMAAEAGFSISYDDNSVLDGADSVLLAANENKDGDFLYGFNDTLWTQIFNGSYENIAIADWTPTWAGEVGEYAFEGKAYGRVVQNVLLLCRTDEYGTNGEALKFEHWGDLTDAGYEWFRQNTVGGTTNTNINSAILYPYIDPACEAGGVSVDGWKKLWDYCAGGEVFTEEGLGFDAMNRGDVAISTYFLSGWYGKINDAADTSDIPLKGTVEPENWALVEVADGTYYIAEYMGILEREGRTAEEDEAVRAFAEWFGSAEVQAAAAEEFGNFPCNKTAAAALYPDGVPAIFTIDNMALREIADTGLTYAAYVAEHITEWTNIQTNLGFFWNDQNSPNPEPDWDNIDWATITQSAP